MEQQVAIVDFIQTSLGVEETDMALELFGMTEGVGELIDHMTFFGSQFIGIVGIDGGEVAVLQRVNGTANIDRLRTIIDPIQQQPVCHSKFGTAQQLLAFQLKENDGNGLVHPGGQQLVLLGILLCISAGELHVEATEIALFINLVGIKDLNASFYFISDFRIFKCLQWSLPFVSIVFS